ncbi:MAG TPA: hypothetical protein VGH87_25745, partial [Polyangiaceae bacterium]
MAEDKSGPSVVVLTAGGCLIVGAIVAIAEVPRIYKEHHAATPENLASVALDQTPKGLARSLPYSKERRTEVEVELRHGTPFEKATFDWSESPDHVSKIWLEAASREERAQKKAGAASRSLAAKLDDVLAGVDDSGHREWGAVDFEASPRGDLHFEVKSTAANN